MQKPSWDGNSHFTYYEILTILFHLEFSAKFESEQGAGAPNERGV